VIDLGTLYRARVELQRTADAAALATPLLKAANASWETVIDKLDEIIQELRITMFCTGAQNLRDLKETPHFRERNP
jgi:isopentenyl diphosphate isomerase/L-lactate dehydrogenase-like FMN-dependent dehydrogenase